MKKSCQRTFQALRIDVNSEFEVLYALMEKLPSALKSGGKVAIFNIPFRGRQNCEEGIQRVEKGRCFTVRLQMMSSDRLQRNVSVTAGRNQRR